MTIDHLLRKDRFAAPVDRHGQGRPEVPDRVLAPIEPDRETPLQMLLSRQLYDPRFREPVRLHSHAAQIARRPPAGECAADPPPPPAYHPRGEERGKSPRQAPRRPRARLWPCRPPRPHDG